MEFAMRVLVSACLLVVASQTQAAVPGSEICSVLIGSPPREVVMPKLQVGALTANSTFVAPRVEKLGAVVCARASLVPAPYDYKVLQAGIPLAIRNGINTLWLELVNGRIQVSFGDDALPSQDIESIQAWLNQAQLEFQNVAPVAPKGGT